jgi:hypothetical protein
MRKKDWRDYWIFGVINSLELLAGIAAIVACWQLGWAGVIGAALVLFVIIVVGRMVRKRISTNVNSN